MYSLRAEPGKRSWTTSCGALGVRLRHYPHLLESVAWWPPTGAAVEWDSVHQVLSGY